MAIPGVEGLAYFAGRFYRALSVPLERVAESTVCGGEIGATLNCSFINLWLLLFVLTRPWMCSG